MGSFHSCHVRPCKGRQEGRKKASSRNNRTAGLFRCARVAVPPLLSRLIPNTWFIGRRRNGGDAHHVRIGVAWRHATCAAWLSSLLPLPLTQHIRLFCKRVYQPARQHYFSNARMAFGTPLPLFHQRTTRVARQWFLLLRSSCAQQAHCLPVYHGENLYQQLPHARTAGVRCARCCLLLGSCKRRAHLMSGDEGLYKANAYTPTRPHS